MDAKPEEEAGVREVDGYAIYIPASDPTSVSEPMLLAA